MSHHNVLACRYRLIETEPLEDDSQVQLLQKLQANVTDSQSPVSFGENLSLFEPLSYFSAEVHVFSLCTDVHKYIMIVKNTRDFVGLWDNLDDFHTLV